MSPCYKGNMEEWGRILHSGTH